MNRYKHIIFLYFFAFLFLIPISDVHSQDRKRLENEKSKLEKEIASMNAILNETKKNKKMSASELQIIRKKVEQRQQLVNNISSQINILDSQIKTTQQSIGESYRNLEIMKQNYAQMLRYAQKNKSSADKLLFIFSSKDYHEAYQRFVFFRKFAQLQRQQMAAIKEKTAELSSMTQDLISQRQNQNILLKQEKVHTANLNKERMQQEKVVNNIKNKEKQLSQQLQQAQAKKKNLQKQIDAAISAEVKKQAQLAAKQKSATNTAKPKANNSSNEKTQPKQEQYVMSANSKEIELSNSFENNKGKLPWPVDKGVIVSGFGVHEHPDIKGVQIENLGVDIRSTKGSKVKSVYQGQVCKVWSGPNGNKIVIIRHGEYMTVYTNLATVSVSDGAQVTTGQVIGTIATNEDNQSEMNFQVRKGVKCQNPVLWLRK